MLCVLFSNKFPIHIDVTAPSDGVFQVAYNYTRARAYWMSVTINDTEVGASPGNIVVQPSAVYPPTCTAEGDATSEAIVKV